ncbi:hypothetical protein ACFQ07_28885 [Actinomadura adrarensis]|uniref:Uncharacterized protein n=1 Tax=Actinomadura adrarensis TaxID=1819600 RepID=A0ABW3CQT5_9ACTN
MHYLFRSGRFPSATKNFIIDSRGGFAADAGLGLHYCAAMFALWTISGLVSCIPGGPQNAEDGTALGDSSPEAMRSFDGSISGELSEVLCYTGATSRLHVEHKGGGPFGIDRLSFTGIVVEEVLTSSGKFQGEVGVPSYSLLQVRGGSGAWSMERSALQT